VIAEHHVDWIADMIGHLLAGDQRWAEACREAEDDWTGLVARVASKSVIPLADSWSMGSNVPGKPRTALFYLGSYSAYRKQCDDVAANGYAGFTLGREAMPAARKRR
jgi:cyclohexanone monooxygenase